MKATPQCRPRHLIANDKPDFLARQIAVPDHQHRHEVDVGDAENGREQQPADVADGRIVVGIGASSAAQASAATSDEMATLAPNDDEVNGASSDKYQSIDTLEMMSA